MRKVNCLLSRRCLVRCRMKVVFPVSNTAPVLHYFPPLLAPKVSPLNLTKYQIRFPYKNSRDCLAICPALATKQPGTALIIKMVLSIAPFSLSDTQLSLSKIGITQKEDLGSFHEEVK